jgi:hypothetical protein
MKKSLGAWIDEIYVADQKIDAAEGVVRGLKEKRRELEDTLLKMFKGQDIDGCKGKTAVARVSKARFPSIKDRRKFDIYVLKNKALDLFQNRISSKAYFARLEEGEKVPGISIFERISVSINKRKE